MSENDVFIVAELSGNHNGKLDNALRLIEEAALAGADAIKLQCYTAETMTLPCEAPEFRVRSGPWAGQHLFNLYHEAATPWDWFSELFQKADDCSLTCFASVFDETSVDFLEVVGCPIYKISSFEITDVPLIGYVAATCKDMIISTGMASDEEIADALDATELAKDVALLHCVSAYPTAARKANLQRIRKLQLFGTGVGLSDHTLSTSLPAVAVGLGAEIIEKHLCLDRSLGGPDASFSLEPHEFARMARNVREAAEAMTVPERPAEPHRELRRSLYAVADIKAGDEFNEANVRSIRPGGGLPPKCLPELLGTQAWRDFPLGTPITLSAAE